jgi:hypothetical protein
MNDIQLGRLYKNEGRGYQYVIPFKVSEEYLSLGETGIHTTVRYYDIKYPENVKILKLKWFNDTYSLVENNLYHFILDR